MFKGFMPYVGNKSREINKIKEHVSCDPESTFVDVFCGSEVVGGNFCKDERFSGVVFNDVDPDVSEMCWVFQDDDDYKNLIRECQKVKTAEEYEQKIKEYPLTKFFLKSVCTFSGMGGKWCQKAYDTRHKSLESKIPYQVNWSVNIGKPSKGINYTNVDYKLIFKLYNKKECFLYLDPPYVTKKDNNYGTDFTVDDLIFIRDFMRNCECKVMLNIDFNGWIYTEFKDMIREVYSHTYSSSNSKERNKKFYTNFHTIITNY